MNNILKEDISIIDHTLLPHGFVGSTRMLRHVREMIIDIIDRLGRHSAIVQDLSRAITTSEKIRISSHITYLLKDSKGNNGKGAAVGFLRIGHKHLYLSDPSDTQGRILQYEPLCVLDFFIEPEYQRSGFGRRLFDYMLQDQNIEPHKLVIDGPSPAMVQFVAKTYGLSDMHRHANNFATPKNFFKENGISTVASAAPTPTTSGAGRYSALHPNSAIGVVIHGSSTASPALPPTPVEAEASISPAKEKAPHVEDTPVEEEIPGHLLRDLEIASPVMEGRTTAERPCTLLVETPAAPDSAASSPAGSVLSRRDSQLTDKGFFDVKFYHNKLW